VLGELYRLPERDTAKKLKELDALEGIDEGERRGGLYKRVELGNKPHALFAFEGSDGLAHAIVERNLIRGGSWRRHGSRALHDPTGFALEFAESERFRYREPPPEGCVSYSYLRGGIPVIVTAPHATRHRRLGAMKYQDRHTGALAVILHALTGCHALYTHWASEVDPNYYNETPFKEALCGAVSEHAIEHVIDLHGTRRAAPHDIYPGIGAEREFALDEGRLVGGFYKSVKNAGLLAGGEDIFRACVQDTVAKFAARKLKTSAIQLEIQERLRSPEENPEGFKKLIECLASFITYLAFS